MDAADVLMLPDAIPCALTPNNQLVQRTCYTKDEAFLEADMLTMTGDGRTVLHTCEGDQIRMLSLTGLPCVGKYKDGSGDVHPYYSLESMRTSAPEKATKQRTMGVLTVPGRLKELGAALPQAAQHKGIKKRVAPRPTLVLGGSGQGKTTLLCVLAERRKLPDEMLAAAVRAAGASPREEKKLDGLRPDMPTLAAFEAYARSYGTGTPRCHATLLAAICDFEQERLDNPDMYTLKARGPLVSLSGSSDHTSNLPILIEASDDLRFRVTFSGISQQEAAAAVDAYRRKRDGQPDLKNSEESKQANLGADLLGFIDGVMPQRLVGVPVGEWALLPEVAMFLGCTFEWSYLAATWEEGKRRMHDVLFDYTVGPWSPWAAISKEGVRAQMPLEEGTSPHMDVQGVLDDESGRNTQLQDMLERESFHSYIIFVNNQLDRDVRDMLRDTRVLGKALKDTLHHERVGTPVGRLEAQPPSVIVVRVSDLQARNITNPARIRSSADDAQRLMPDKFRHDLAHILDDPAEPADQVEELVNASCDRFVQFFSVSTMRQPALRMQELDAAIQTSFQKNLKAQCRALAHSIMAKGVDMLNALDSVRQAGDASQRDLTASSVEAAHMLAMCEEALKAQKAVQQSDRDDSESEDSDKEEEDAPTAMEAATTLDAHLGKLIDDMMLKELLDGLKSSCAAVDARYSASVFLGHVADEGLINAPGGESLTPDQLGGRVNNEQAAKQVKWLEASTDLRSPLLAACLRPARQALSCFEGNLVAKFVSGENTAWASDLVDQFLENAFQTEECKAVIDALKHTRAPPPGLLRTFQLAQELREALYDALVRMQRMLSILNLGNILHATQRCGIADELFVKVARETLKLNAAKTPVAACARYERLSALVAGTREPGVNRKHAAYRPGLVRGVMYFMWHRLRRLLERTKDEVVKDALKSMHGVLSEYTRGRTADGASGSSSGAAMTALTATAMTALGTSGMEAQKGHLELMLVQISALLKEHNIESDDSIFERIAGGIQATDAQAQAEQERRAAIRGILEKHNFTSRRITRSQGLDLKQVFTFNGFARYELRELAKKVLNMESPIKDSDERLRAKLREKLKPLLDELLLRNMPASTHKAKKPRLE